jgi:hypothetical protein
LKNYFIVLLFLVFFISIAFAQEEKSKNPDVELPEFVITGSDILSIQKGKKIDPEILPILNEQFLKPAYSPEDLKLRELSDPIRNEFSLTDSLNYFTGKLEAKAGIYTIPEVRFSLSNPFENGLYQFFAKGKNRRSFVENSGLYDINGGLNVFYQLASESMLFNGTKFQLHGDYGRTSYKLYAANDPFIKRELNKGNVRLNIENLLEDKFNYVLSFSDDIHSLQDNVYSENFLDFGAMFRAKLEDINFGVNSAYKVQFFKNDFVKQSTTDFFFIRPFIGYSYNDRLKASIGINYFSFRDEVKVYPYLFLGSRISDKISLFAEYSPQVVFCGNGFFLDANPYFYVQNFVNLIYEKKNSLEISLKYDYEKYYEINGGIKYFSSPTLPYFESSALDGRFNVVNTSAESYTGFVNLLFHLGPYGYFYGSVEMNQTKSKDGKILPYHPSLNSDLTYGYNFRFGLNCELTLSYLSKQYINKANDELINPFVNLGAKFSYKLVQDFELTLEADNLLNRKNYLWYNYQEPPLELTCGLIYRW